MLDYHLPTISQRKKTSMARKTRKLNVQECKTSKELCKKNKSKELNNN
jgi:hypothetical protein